MGPEYGLTPADKFLLIAMRDAGRRRRPGALHLRGRAVRRPQLDDRQRALLLVPTVAALRGHANPARRFDTFLVVRGAVAGIGGGNFASSMTNINAFFPQRMKGWALGLNAGGGNIGVPADPAGRPARDRDRGQPAAVLGVRRLPVAGRRWPRSGRPVHGQPATIVTSTPAPCARRCAHRHTWISQPALHRHLRLVHRLLVRLRPGAADHRSPRAAKRGAGVAARRRNRLHRPAARLARTAVTAAGSPTGSAAAAVTLWAFVGMIARRRDPRGHRHARRRHQHHRRDHDLVCRSASSCCSPAQRHRQRRGVQDDPVDLRGGVALAGSRREGRADYSRSMSGAVIGITGAIGGLGGVVINLMLRSSYLTHGTATVAFWDFAAFYAIAAFVTVACVRADAVRLRRRSAHFGHSPCLGGHLPLIRCRRLASRQAATV